MCLSFRKRVGRRNDGESRLARRRHTAGSWKSRSWRLTISGGRVRDSATLPAANWNKFNSCWGTCLCKQQVDWSLTAKSGRVLAEYMGYGQTAQLAAAQHPATK